jgi:hypothetical protein
MLDVEDMKNIVRELADSLSAIFEPAPGGGFAIEVPLPLDRFQSVTLTAVSAKDGKVLRLVTRVGELEASARTVIDKWKRRAKGVEITLEPSGATYEATVSASLPLAKATRDVVEPILMEVATLGDGIENELTGGDVD